MIELTWLTPGGDKSGCYAVRRRVFVDEQGFADEFDDIDKTCEHLLVTDDGAPIGAARLYQQDGAFHAGRVCVDAACRGQGLGKRIMDAVERRAKARGAAALELGAQTQVQAFYARCGYASQGEPYYEQHCRHVVMRKVLE